MNKQILTDILVVLIVPVCLIALYHFVLSRETPTDELLSISPTSGEAATPGVEASELGAKSKQILTELNSINFDESFFSDPVFLSLKDFTPAYATTSIGRDYPFSMPDAVRALNASPRTLGGSTKEATTTKKVR